MSEIICPYCGASNSIDAVICSTCKLPLYDDAEPAPSTPQPVSLDWLDQLREPENRSASPGETTQIEASPVPGPEIPDWLARIRARKSEDIQRVEPEGTQPANTIPSTAPVDNIPDWIKEIKQGDIQPAIQEEESSGTIPEWLQSMAKEDDLPLGETPSSSNWMDSTQQEPDSYHPHSEGPVLPEEYLPQSPPAVPIEPSEAAKPEEEAPNLDWLSERFSSQIPEPTDSSSTPAHIDLSTPDNNAPLADQTAGGEIADLPDWLVESDKSDSSAAATGPDFNFTSLRNDLSTVGPAGEGSGLAEEGLPEWLFDQPVEPVKPGMEYPSSATPELEKGQLPGWLNAMRPVEAAAPELPLQIEDNRVEPSGPLAGFQGILPGQGAVTHYSHPPVYSSQMQVTDKQRIYATLFDTLIADEQKVGSAATARSTTVQQVIRLVLGLVLVIGLIAILLLQPGFASYPTLVAPESVAFYETMHQLTSSTNPPRVLIGLDYEASLSGEMRTISTAVLESWMDGNTGLTFISINPSGPALAEELANTAAANVPGYIAAERVINLGYLPGGVSALSLLATDPRLAAPSTFDNLPAWDSLLLQGVAKITDFDAVLLLTDNAENARGWIEQVKTSAINTPLLVVSSAQTAPVLQPYVQSGQITGMIAGLQGGAVFEQLAQNQSGPVRRYWDAYQIGLLFAAALILLGAVFFNIRNSVTRAKKA